MSVKGERSRGKFARTGYLGSIGNALKAAARGGGGMVFGGW